MNLADIISKNTLLEVKSYLEVTDNLNVRDLKDSLSDVIQREGNFELASYLLEKLNFVRNSKISFNEVYEMFLPISVTISLNKLVVSIF